MGSALPILKQLWLEFNKNNCVACYKDCVLINYYHMHGRDGTTDVTRTMHFGTPTDKQRVSIHRLCVTKQ